MTAELKLLRKIKISPRKRLIHFRQAAVNEQGSLLLHLPRKIQSDLLSRIDTQELIALLKYLDPHDTTTLLQGIDKRRAGHIINALSEDMKQKVEYLLQFHPQTAAGMMSLDYIEVEHDASIKEAAATIQKHEKTTGRFPTVLVVAQGILKGELRGHIFAIAKPGDQVKKFSHRVPHIRYNQDQKEVQGVFQKSAHSKVVVLDEDESIMGIIYADDILKLLHRNRGRDLYNFAGVTEEEDALDSALTKVRYRYKWLIINLGTAFLAAGVVGMFEDTISRFVLLAIYMPIVAGMGGNAGTQSMAVAIRGLALKEVELSRSRKLIANEVIAGAVNGTINGLIVAAIAVFWNQSPELGFVLGIAMVINLIIAGFFGALIPLIMQKLGKDPASSATIFITTATDVFGFMVFLGLAKLVL